MGSTEDKTTVIATASGEGVKTSPELASDLFIGGPTPWHQYHVEPSQTKDGDEEESNDNHNYNTCYHGLCRVLRYADYKSGRVCAVLSVVEHMYQTEGKYGDHVYT